MLMCHAAIIEDARHPNKYRMLVGMVDVVFADVAQPDQVSESIGEFKDHFLIFRMVT